MGYSAFGTILRIDTTDNGTPDTAVARLTNIGGPNLSMDTIDVSTHDSWKNADAIGTCTFTHATNMVNAVGHGLQTGDIIGFRLGIGGVLPAELSTERWYHAIRDGADTFQVAVTRANALAGTEVVFTDDGTTPIISFFYAYAYKEFAGGILDGGEVPLAGHVTTIAAANILVTAKNTRGIFAFDITYPTGSKWAFDGIITGFETEAPHDGKLGFTASIKLDGKPVLT